MKPDNMSTYTWLMTETGLPTLILIIALGVTLGILTRQLLNSKGSKDND